MEAKITQDYFETLFKLQTDLTFRIVRRMGEELFPGDGAKMLVLNTILEEGLKEINDKVGVYIKEKYSLPTPP